MTRWSCVGVLLTLAAGPQARAADPRLVVQYPNDDKRLRFWGEVGAAQSSLANSVFVKLDSGATPVAIRLQPRPLEGVTPRGEARVIPAQSITIPQGVKVTSDGFTEVRIAISGLKDAASYQGTLRIEPDAGAKAAPIDVSVVVDAETRPAAAPVGNFRMQVVKCTWLTCWAANWFVRSLSRDQQWPLGLRGSGDDAAALRSVQFLLAGEKSGRAVSGEVQATVVPPSDTTPDALRKLCNAPARARAAHDPAAPEPSVICPGAARMVPVRVDPGDLPADRYVGDATARLEGPGPAALRQDFAVHSEISVRDGLGLPVLLVVIGIILGRIARGLDTPAAQAQLRLQAAWKRAVGELDLLGDGALREAMRLPLNDVEASINSGDPEPQVQERIVTIRHLLDVWRSVEVTLSRLAQAEAAALTSQVNGVRAAVVSLDAKAADAAYEIFADAARDEISNRKSIAPADVEKIARAMIAPGPQRKAIPTVRRRDVWLNGALGFVSGYTTPTAQMRWIAAQAMFAVLLVILVLIGLQNLYVAVPTFGANGFYDYLGLVLWGLSADVAQRTLQSLPALRP